MKRIIAALPFALLLCLVAPVCAQQQDQGPRPDGASQQEGPRPAPEAAPRQEKPETPPARQERKEQEPQAKPDKQEKQEKQETPKESREQPKAGQQEEHGQTAQKGQTKVSVKGGHIPDAKFKASFGRPHRFAVNRVITTTTIVPQQTQFVYSGVTFVFVDPWPAGWAFTDDCYIDYVDDQYFLFDELHPGVQVALLVVE